MKTLQFVVILPLVNALIQIPFIGQFESEKSPNFNVNINISIGSPPQKMEVELGNDLFMPDLTLLDGDKFDVGFYPKKSWSFYQWDDSIDEDKDLGETIVNGINGTDTFDLNGTIVERKPFKVENTTWRLRGRLAVLGLTRHQITTIKDSYDRTTCPRENSRCTTFIQSILQDKKDQHLILAVDKVTPQQNFTGQLIFGEKENPLCQNNWTYFPEIPQWKAYQQKQWMFNVDWFSVGGKKIRLTGVQGTIGFDSSKMTVPNDLGGAIQDAFDPRNIRIDVPCNSTMDLVFYVEGREIRVKAEQYIVKNDGHTCKINMEGGSETYLKLPIHFFGEHCILYDYTYRNSRIGLTDRVGNEQLESTAEPKKVSQSVTGPQSVVGKTPGPVSGQGITSKSINWVSVSFGSSAHTHVFILFLCLLLNQF